MARGRAHVNEYTRTLADGTEVKVGEHDRAFDGAAKPMKKTPVQAHRQAREKAAKRTRRSSRRKKGLFQVRRANARLKKAVKAAKRRKRATAVALLIGGLVELSAWFTFNVVGAIITAVVVILTLLAGALLSAGGSDRP